MLAIVQLEEVEICQGCGELIQSGELALCRVLPVPGLTYSDGWQEWDDEVMDCYHFHHGGLPEALAGAEVEPTEQLQERYPWTRSAKG